MFITFSELHKQMWWTNWTAYTLSLLLSSLPKRLSNIIYHDDQGNGELVDELIKTQNFREVYKRIETNIWRSAYHPKIFLHHLTQYSEQV